MSSSFEFDTFTTQHCYACKLSCTVLRLHRVHVSSYTPTLCASPLLKPGTGNLSSADGQKRLYPLFSTSKQPHRLLRWPYKPLAMFVSISSYGCAVSSVLCSGPWGYPSRTIHLKTASWPWQKANWDCQSTPVCWSMPSSSGDWGESLKPCDATLPSKRAK